ncbi:FUSC family protein [Bacillus sp. 37MA]|uniref:FUSC family protein n=1 Tax=Bacillus sp. 37MA TaxID=1132442 RepID=UPI00036BCF7E|nr:FUSC family protein [Bacillus sp. 37MA]
MDKKKQKKSSTSISLKSTEIHSTIKQAFEIKKNPFPWIKAFSAGVSASLPVFIGLLLGSLQYGLLAGIGAFTYLYVFNQPYAQRAKKLFFVMIGISLSVGVGTLIAPYPLASAIMMGVIGAVAIFIFGALKISGPSAIFFVLSFAMATGMPVDPSLAPLRTGLVFLGGVLSWLIAMLGWLISPREPETNVVKRVYMELAAFLDSVGKENFNETRQRTVSAMKQAEDILSAGYISWQSSDMFKRLYLLTEHANTIFLEVLEIALEEKAKLPPELGESIRALANSIEHKKKNNTKILQPDHVNEAAEHLFVKIYNADAIMNEPISRINQEVRISKRSLKTVFLGAFDKNSIVFLSSVKYGTVLTFAAIIAYTFDFNRSYWIPLSCAAVMSGATIIATFHRAVQRFLGTIVGILVASIILSSTPQGYIIAIIILVLTFFTELFIVRNYGFAAMFFTPSALIMAEYTTQVHDFAFFATVRVTDIFIGCVIGLIGTLLIGRRSASSLLPHFIAKTIRSEGQFLLMLFSEHNSRIDYEESRERSKMQTNLTNLKTVYNTASGELFSNKTVLDSLWPVIFSIEQMGYLLDSSLKYDKRPVLSDESLAQLLYTFETMAMAAEQNQPHTEKNTPDIQGFSKIKKEIIALQNALQISERVPG